MKIYLDGLERSGNVFLSYAISLITGKQVIAVRDHMVKVLKDYDKEYPFVVPVRDALPCIASAKIYRDKVVTSKFHESGENDTKELSTCEEIEATVSKNEDVYDTESGNLPRPTPKKGEVEKILKDQFLEQIQGIQANIDKLYQRYYDLP